MAADPGVSIDIFERIGAVRTDPLRRRPDHPRIKGIITALHQVLDKPQIRLFGNVDYGTDVHLDDLRAFYDGVIFATGATADRALPIPGIDLDGSYGAADFVSWYDGHPDVPAPGRWRPRRSPSSASATSPWTWRASSPRRPTSCCPRRSRRTSTRA